MRGLFWFRVKGWLVGGGGWRSPLTFIINDLFTGEIGWPASGDEPTPLIPPLILKGALAVGTPNLPCGYDLLRPNCGLELGAPLRLIGAGAVGELVRSLYAMSASLNVSLLALPGSENPDANPE